MSSIRRLTIALFLASCAPGSSGPWLTATTPEQHEPRFPIVAGPHGGLACNECHGEFDTFREFSCTSCHTHAQSETDPKHDGVPGYLFERRICLQCHPTGQAADRTFHAQYFPIDEASPHGAETCAGCHPEPGRPELVTCIDCHAHLEPDMASRHQGVADYRWETPACLTCHPTGIGLDRESHGEIFPIAAGTAHEAEACEACHTDPGAWRTVECILCHTHERGVTDGAHGEVGSYAYASPGCLRCHYDSSVPRIRDHVPFRVDRSSRHRAENAGCLECHPAYQVEKPFGADFESFDCSPCHSRREMDDEHGDRPGYVYDFPTCIQSGCHPTGEGD